MRRSLFSLPPVGRWLLAVLLVLGLLPLASQAQVVDDSTKVLYGPKSTFIIREAEVLRDTITPRMVDTTLTRLPQDRYWFHDSTFQQDLGNLGTASRPLLWQTNTQLGNRLGRNVFDKYVIKPAELPYYDVRSPYTYFRVNQGGTGESTFEIGYTRSIKKNFNVGVRYERYSTNKMLATISGRDGMVEHSNVAFFVRYNSEDGRYHGLFNVTTARHNAVEQGGIREVQSADPNVRQTLETNTLFNYQTAVVYLTNAANRDDRNQVHLAHTYRLLGQGLTAYHVLDYSTQRNRFTDTSIPNAGSTGYSYYAYPNTYLNLTRTDDQASYRQLENTVGFLGSTPRVAYRVYARQRGVSLALDSKFTAVGGGDSTGRAPNLPLPSGSQNPIDARRLGKPLPVYDRFLPGQVFLGGTADFNYKIFAIETAGEYMVGDEYWLRGRAKLGFLTGEYLSTSYSPTLTQREFSGNHLNWQNDFKNTKVNQVTVRAAYALDQHQLEAAGSAILINSLVYYDTDLRPAQAGNAQQLLTARVRHRYNIHGFYFDNEATFTAGDRDSDDGIRIPALVSLSRVYYQNYLFKRALFGQVGAELYYQSTFRGYQYSPSTQQFYVQDNFTIRNYPVINVFLSGDVKTVGVFVKLAYANQGLDKNGYFTTPYYSALERRVQFGLRWQFFN